MMMSLWSMVNKHPIIRKLLSNVKTPALVAGKLSMIQRLGSPVPCPGTVTSAKEMALWRLDSVSNGIPLPHNDSRGTGSSLGLESDSLLFIYEHQTGCQANGRSSIGNTRF